MTIALDPGPQGPIALADFVDRIAASGFDPDDEAHYAALAAPLAALSANRSFLGDLMIAELKSRAAGQEAANDYGPQVVLLHRGPGWFARANIWPAAADALLRASGPRRFFYGVPHEHNFTFLTVGHMGPGYWSDYYDFDPDAVAGVPGEPAGLRFVARSRLAEGRMLLYRAGRDVHAQDLPDATSVSLNICQGTPGRGFVDQYRFDLDRGLIAGQLAQTSTEPMLALMPTLGGGEGAMLLDDFARRHPSPRIRHRAIGALAAAAPDLDARAAVLARAADDPCRTVAGLARHDLAMLATARAWRTGARP